MGKRRSQKNREAFPSNNIACQVYIFEGKELEETREFEKGANMTRVELRKVRLKGKIAGGTKSEKQGERSRLFLAESGKKQP